MIYRHILRVYLISFLLTFCVLTSAWAQEKSLILNNETLICPVQSWFEENDFDKLSANVDQSLDQLWWQNRAKQNSCQRFVAMAMKTGAPERGQFKQVQTRLNEIYNSSEKDKAHLFYRAFPDIYYFLLANKKTTLPTDQLKQFEGLILGDVHVENFGVIKYDTKNKVKFKLSVNDFDEVGHGPYYSDVLRLMTSIKLAEEKLPQKISQAEVTCLLQIYQTGVSGLETLPNCHFIAESSDEYLRNLKSAKKAYKKTFLSSDKGKPSYSKPLNKMSSACEEEHSSLNSHSSLFTPQVPESLYENAKAFKHRCKVSGGSGLLTSTQFVEKEKVDNDIDRLKTVEVKTLTLNSAVAQYNVEANKNHSKLISNALDIYGFDKSIKIASTDRDYIIREKKGGNRSYRPFESDEDDSAQDAKKKTYTMLKDQFYTLGKMHKKSLKAGQSEDVQKEYIEHLKKMSSEDWLESSQKIKEELMKYFNACNLK